jgi:hypothetical protein
VETLPHGYHFKPVGAVETALESCNNCSAILPMTAYDDDFAEKPEYILSMICLELMDENIDKFVSVV